MPSDFDRYYQEYDPERKRIFNKDRYLDFSVWLAGKCAGYEVMLRALRKEYDELLKRVAEIE